MTPTEKSAQRPSLRTGAFATLAALLHLCGTGLSKSARGTGVSSSLLLLPALVLAFLAFTAASALAAAPSVISESFSGVKATEARLEALVNPNSEVTECHFEYGSSAVTEHEVQCEAPLIEGGEQGVGVTVPGLTQHTAYHYRVVLKNLTAEEAKGNEEPFETALPPEAPETTSPAKSITATSATLEGVLDPISAGDAGTYEFLYRVSPTECEGERAAPVEPEPLGVMSGAAKQAVSVPVTALQPNATYTFCLLARNAAGETAVGPPVSFATSPAPPTVESESTSNVKTTEARLEGVLNPNNELTECKFQYGTEPLLNTGVTSRLCEPGSFTASFGGQGVGLNIGELQAGTTYYYRIVAENEQSRKEGKPGEGAIEQFTTAFPFTEAPEAKPAIPIAATEATLHGVLNPKSERASEPGTAEFVYRPSSTECRGENERQAGDEKSPEGHEAEAAEAKVSELSPGTTYTSCVRVVNKAGEEQVSPPETFTTPAVPLEIAGTSATDVTATAAKLKAQVNPGGAETTYHFEYDTSPYTTSAPHGQRTPESPSIGADNSLHSATAAVQGLQPGTTYHYRIVATNSQSPAGGTLGPDQTFTTETTGGEFALPDGRGYELVSPPQKEAAEVFGIGGGGVTPAGGDATEASEDGTRVTYITSAPVGANPPGNMLSTQILSTRGAGGWTSLDIATPHKHSIEAQRILSEGEEYLRFSPDLSHALLVPLYGALEPPLAPELHQEVAGETEIYLRDNATNTFRAVLTSEPLPKLSFEGATPDLSHVVFGGPSSFGNIEPGGPVGLDPTYPNAGGLYEWADRQTRLVSVLPNKSPATGLTMLGSNSPIATDTRVSATRHAISDDGTRIVWSGEGGLFARDMVTGETLQVDAVQSGGGVAGGGAFRVASSDGSRIFFTDGNDLVSGAHGGDLYMFEPARPEGEQLTDLTLGVAGAESGGVNVLEANATGTLIYISSSGNTYLLREAPIGSGSWSSTFVTSGLEEGPSEGAELRAAEPLQRQAARVSPSGRYLAFMSRRSLTGYDNRDANSGEPDEEVYLYDAETNRLACSSCDPTGARPVGQFDTQEFPGIAMDPSTTWQGRWVAAVIPGWTEDGAFRSTGHQPRYLGDSGRLFFTSSDALVPSDVNGREDVYEYDPVGVGSCQPPSYGQGASVVFSKALGSCIGLISAGTGNADSVFFDASASGNDVFFTTQDGLVQNDRDGTADMYNARVCTQAEPCPSAFPISLACTTTDSCRVAPSPQPGVFGAPPSATFAGAGNVTPTPSATKKTTKKKLKTGKCTKRKKRSHRRCGKAKKKTGAKRARNDRRLGR